MLQLLELFLKFQNKMNLHGSLILKRCVKTKSGTDIEIAL
ncbi:uncharacterized protein METZ01_LOCUS60707 [marine metagenome]|uniref:Uncharacterized protein n=1 Tax=marine metagenome TaxID=408172 RepID=A0A381T2F6_9ZZZZ